MASISQRGDGWQAKIRRKGYPAQSATFDTKAQAERWAREIEGKMDRGTFVHVDQEARRVTLEEALKRYLREVTAHKKTNGPEKSKVNWWLRQPLAIRPLAAIRTHDLAEIRDEMVDEGYAANTIRLKFAVLSHLFTVAASEWKMEGLANPVLSLRRPSVTDSARDRRLEPGEWEVLEVALAKGPDFILPCAELAVETAMRRGELASMEWERVHLDRGFVHLPETKNGSARMVPLSPRAMTILQRLKDKAEGKVDGATPIREIKAKGRVFAAHVDNISHAFADAVAEAKIEDLHFHDLRHEATSRLFERGNLNIVEIATITGHKTLQMLKRYTHPRATDLVKKLAQAA